MDKRIIFIYKNYPFVLYALEFFPRGIFYYKKKVDFSLYSCVLIYDKKGM